MCSRLVEEKKWRAEKECHSWVHYQSTQSLSHCSMLQRSRRGSFQKQSRMDLGWLGGIRSRHQVNCSRRCSIRCSRRCWRLSVEYPQTSARYHNGLSVPVLLKSNYRDLSGSAKSPSPWMGAPISKNIPPPPRRPKALKPWSSATSIRPTDTHEFHHFTRALNQGRQQWTFGAQLARVQHRPEIRYPAQLYCDNSHTRAFDVMPTSHHGTFCIILC